MVIPSRISGFLEATAVISKGSQFPWWMEILLGNKSLFLLWVSLVGFAKETDCSDFSQHICYLANYILCSYFFVWSWLSSVLLFLMQEERLWMFGPTISAISVLRQNPAEEALYSISDNTTFWNLLAQMFMSLRNSWVGKHPNLLFWCTPFMTRNMQANSGINTKDNYLTRKHRH